MNVSCLSHLELDSKIKSLAQKERELLREVLLHIHEADRRRLYLELAYPSLFAYLTEGCGYSGGAAHRRMEAARLMIPVPEVAEKLESGELSLSQVSALQRAIRQKNKTAKVDSAKKREIVKKICSKSQPETQKIIAQELDLELKQIPKETHQKDESIRLELTFSKEQWAELLQAREILSHSVHSGDWSEVFSYLAKKVIQKKSLSAKTPAKAAITSAVDGQTAVTSMPHTPAPPPSKMEVTSSRNSTVKPSTRSDKPIPNSIKKIILNRDQACQYRNKFSGKICGGKWNLEIDHIQPRWANGGNEENNLRVLCRKHDQFIYRKQVGY